MVQGPSQQPCEGGTRCPCSPASVFCSPRSCCRSSILVFGLGAAALLRAAHEEFASNSSWRVALEPKFAQQDAAAILRGSQNARAGEYCASNRSRRSENAARAFRSLPRRPSRRRVPLPDQPGKIAALTPAAFGPAGAGKPESPVGEPRCKARHPSPRPRRRAAGIAAAEQRLPPAKKPSSPNEDRTVGAGRRDRRDEHRHPGRPARCHRDDTTGEGRQRQARP